MVHAALQIKHDNVLPFYCSAIRCCQQHTKFEYCHVNATWGPFILLYVYKMF
jgi:hypothetical protein